MNRSVSLVAAILAALSMSLVSAEEDPPVDAVHLRGAVWMLRTNTPIGNPSTVVAATEDATLVVDPNLLAASAPLREAIEKLGGGPIRWVTATHSHGDHSEGFEVFTEGTAIVPSAQRYQLATGRIVKG